MKEFHINTEIFFGEKALDRLSMLPFKNVLIITDPFVVSSGMITLLTTRLDKAHIEYALFTDVVPDPPVEKVISGVATVMQTKPPCIICVGGGSAIDTAKAVKKFAKQFDAEYDPHLIAIPTTSGTGSEVTKVSVITTPDGRKKSFHHEAIFPALSLGDPTYTMSLSPMVTRATMVDVLAHCAESFFSRSANHLSQCYAVEGIRLLLPVMRWMEENGCDHLDYDTREQLYCAAIYGGLAINVTGTCFPHTMGYLLTESFGIPHGTACAVFQKDFYEYNKTVVPALAAEYLERIGCGEEEYFRLLETLIPPCDITMDEACIAEAHSRWVNNGSMAKCQGDFTADMADDVLRRKFLKI